MSNQILRALNASDISTINAVRYSATRRFGDEYQTADLTPEVFFACLKDDLAFGIETDDSLVAVCYGVFEDHDIHIEFIGVRREYEGRRLGVALLSHFMDIAQTHNAQRLTLITSGTAPWNHRYYLQNGFHDMDLPIIPPYLATRLESQKRHFANQPLLLPRIPMARIVE